MERRDVIGLLQDVEKRYSVNSWQYTGIDIWPIIKKDIFFSWFLQQPGQIKAIPPIKKDSFFSKITKIIRSFLAWQYFCIKAVKPVQTFYCGSWTHRVDWEGKFINRYYFPLINEAPSKKFKIIEYGCSKKGKNYPFIQDTLFIDQFLLAILMFIKLKMPVKNLPLKDLEAVKKELQPIYKGNINEYFRVILKKNIAVQLAYIKIFKRCFKKYRPQQSLGLCYYNAPMHAMHFVANSEGIPNFDVQHGGQGRLHPMYIFQNPPIEGYNILPKTFWCWDEASKHNIESWTKMQKFHQVKCNGNPWIDFLLTQSFPIDLGQKKMILYTIQEEQLDTYILDTIKNTPKDYSWWLRLHPRKNAAKATVESQLLKKEVLERVEIEQAIALPLPILLKSASVHISKFSGSVIEAAQIGTKTVIIDAIGAETYAEYIQNNDAVVCLEKNAESLLTIIKMIIKNKDNVVSTKN